MKKSINLEIVVSCKNFSIKDIIIFLNFGECRKGIQQFHTVKCCSLIKM